MWSLSLSLSIILSSFFSLFDVFSCVPICSCYSNISELPSITSSPSCTVLRPIAATRAAAPRCVKCAVRPRRRRPKASSSVAAKSCHSAWLQSSKFQPKMSTSKCNQKMRNVFKAFNSNSVELQIWSYSVANVFGGLCCFNQDRSVICVRQPANNSQQNDSL